MFHKLLRHQNEKIQLNCSVPLNINWICKLTYIHAMDKLGYSWVIDMPVSSPCHINNTNCTIEFIDIHNFVKIKLNESVVKRINYTLYHFINFSTLLSLGSKI